jgi:general secretion pathway protein G
MKFSRVGTRKLSRPKNSIRTELLDEAGFTLVELLVVLVILVLLASIIGPRVIGYLGSSRTKTASVQISNLATSLELYHLDMGRYPTSSEGLQALIASPHGAVGWNGPYVSKSAVPLDPWGRPYRYSYPGKKNTFDLFSFGRDDKEGGSDEDKDVWN